MKDRQSLLTQGKCTYQCHRIMTASFEQSKYLGSLKNAPQTVSMMQPPSFLFFPFIIYPKVPPFICFSSGIPHLLSSIH